MNVVLNQFTMFFLHRHVLILLSGAKGSGQHPETPGQGGGPLYDAHQCPDAQQRTRGHDHVCNYQVFSPFENFKHFQ